MFSATLARAKALSQKNSYAGRNSALWYIDTISDKAYLRGNDHGGLLVGRPPHNGATPPAAFRGTTANLSWKGRVP
jgi:hypothetical protein